MTHLQQQDIVLSPGLYLIATPIGNLRDMSLRALDTLAAADAVLCEDSRMTGKLLQMFGLKKKMMVYNDHSDEAQRGGVIKMLAEGRALALVSDAGMPLISDPGYKLVRDCLDRGLSVTSVPGANAPLTALQLSGLPTDKFSFLGFMPAKTEGRKKMLTAWKNVPGTLVLFESGPRLAASLADMAAVLGDRPAAVVRELTKMHEEVRRGALAALAAGYEAEDAPRGEIVVVIGEAAATDWDDAALDDELRAALATMRIKDAAAFVADKTGLQKTKLYDRALALRDRDAS
ncbi:MAG: 16S rRNA (cytidine(1402)-2'-O)-methyltransferase [Rhodospirillales bacterium]|nr:16S rRNA (cytidine(1402)-2'-O)-methyltransferase [Rhodospirillales bacterium]